MEFKKYLLLLFLISSSLISIVSLKRIKLNRPKKIQKKRDIKLNDIIAEFLDNIDLPVASTLEDVLSFTKCFGKDINFDEYREKFNQILTKPKKKHHEETQEENQKKNEDYLIKEKEKEGYKRYDTIQEAFISEKDNFIQLIENSTFDDQPHFKKAWIYIDNYEDTEIKVTQSIDEKTQSYLEHNPEIVKKLVWHFKRYFIVSILVGLYNESLKTFKNLISSNDDNDFTNRKKKFIEQVDSINHKLQKENTSYLSMKANEEKIKNIKDLPFEVLQICVYKSLGVTFLKMGFLTVELLITGYEVLNTLYKNEENKNNSQKIGLFLAKVFNTLNGAKSKK